MWWNDMSTLQQVVFIIACAATAILILQIILMLIGGAHDADVPGGGLSDADISGGGMTDADVPGGGLSDMDIPSGDIDVGGLDVSLDLDTDIDTSGSSGEVTGHSGAAVFGLRLLSFRSIIAFLAIGCWVCYTVCYALPWYGAVPIAVLCGFAAASGVTAAIMGMEKLQTNGVLNPKNALGKIGTVYLTVPPERSGRGKVNILIQERYAEYEAITNSETPLPTSSEIKVVGYAGANVLIVEKYKKPSITIENV